MRKIIEGRKYDTDTSCEVYRWKSGRVVDFYFIDEALYRKRNGEYFIHGYGHAETKYAKYNELAGGWEAGEAIVPLSYDDAARWMEQHADADAYEAEFGEISEGGGQVAVTVRVSEGAKAKLAREAARLGVSQGELVERMIARLG